MTCTPTTHDVFRSLPERDEVGTVADLVNVKQLAATIRESNEHVIKVALAREGLTIAPEKLERIVKELANNAAMVVGVMEVG